MWTRGWVLVNEIEEGEHKSWANEIKEQEFIKSQGILDKQQMCTFALLPSVMDNFMGYLTGSCGAHSDSVLSNSERIFMDDINILTIKVQQIPSKL